jgi:hypothetical protein
MSDLYDTDVVIWSERQAPLLRQRADGELVNVADIDRRNVAETSRTWGEANCGHAGE